MQKLVSQLSVRLIFKQPIWSDGCDDWYDDHRAGSALVTAATFSWTVCSMTHLVWKDLESGPGSTSA